MAAQWRRIGKRNHPIVGFAVDDVFHGRKNVLCQDTAAALEAEGLLGIGVDQEIKQDNGEVKIQCGRQIGLQHFEDSVEVDIDDDQSIQAAVRVKYLSRDLQR